MYSKYKRFSETFPLYIGGIKTPRDLSSIKLKWKLRRDETEYHCFWLFCLEHIPLDLCFPDLTEHNNYLENSGKKIQSSRSFWYNQ